jgi:D-threo-aldose 1-dehydrogenase
MIDQERVFLAAAGRWTTRAGFGCSGLMGALSRRESLALLSVAWDAGIRHFDVAPVYGHGEAERVLGSFLAGRRDQATVVTKFGLQPTGNSRFVEIARAVARPLLRRAPALKPSSAATATRAAARAPLDARNAERSLASSLRALQTDSIDVLLLHEAETHLLHDDSLLAFLENSVRKGLIRTFGIGGDSRKASDVFQKRRAYCSVVQCDCSPLDGELPDFPGSDLIVFGVLARHGNRPNPPGQSQEPPLNTEVILRAAAIALPNSVILFSSRNAAHVASSAKAVMETTLDSAANLLLVSAGRKVAATN